MATGTDTPSRRWTADPELLRCVRCHGRMEETERGLACPSCGAEFPVRDGVLVVKDEATADNKIAQDFYNSPLWPKFRFWERVFWVLNGGERKSRDVILRHLPTTPGISLLDVAIGDGVYTEWLPADWSIVGVDVSKAQLAACSQRNARRSDLRLILGEAESLPFHDRRFDAVLSIGGFNHFNDPEGALREMVRVAKPRAPVVISDELPDLTDRMLGHRIGLPGIDRWFVSRMMKLGDAFTDLVERHRKMDVAAIGKAVLSDCRYEVIWRGGGYLMVGTAP
jgi:ubiquinone/menaquinone biosynthesis C-methylase UbiE